LQGFVKAEIREEREKKLLPPQRLMHRRENEKKGEQISAV